MKCNLYLVWKGCSYFREECTVDRLCPCSDMAVMQKATEKSGKRDPEMKHSEEDLRLERIVARLREPMQDAELPQPLNAEPVCSAGQVSYSWTSHYTCISITTHTCHVIVRGKSAPTCAAQPEQV